MKKYISKKIALLTSAALLLLIAVGTTVAYLVVGPDSIENTFTPSRVACAVVENGHDPVSGAIVDMKDPKKDVQIKNTGDTDAYIRVDVVVNWTNAKGTKVWAQKPADADYEITYNLSEAGWVKGSDGYYYYTKAVSPGLSTETLIKVANLAAGVKPPVGTDGTRYYLSIEVVASAIQATSDAVSAWSNGVATADTDGGTLTVSTTNP